MTWTYLNHESCRYFKHTNPETFNTFRYYLKSILGRFWCYISHMFFPPTWQLNKIRMWRRRMWSFMESERSWSILALLHGMGWSDHSWPMFFGRLKMMGAKCGSVCWTFFFNVVETKYEKLESRGSAVQRPFVEILASWILGLSLRLAIWMVKWR